MNFNTDVNRLSLFVCRLWCAKHTTTTIPPCIYIMRYSFSSLRRHRRRHVVRRRARTRLFVTTDSIFTRIQYTPSHSEIKPRSISARDLPKRNKIKSEKRKKKQYYLSRSCRCGDQSVAPSLTHDTLQLIRVTCDACMCVCVCV